MGYKFTKFNIDIGRIEPVCNNIKLATDAIPNLSEPLQETVRLSEKLKSVLPGYNQIEGYEASDNLQACMTKEVDSFAILPADLRAGLEVMGKSAELLKPQQDQTKRLIIIAEHYTSIGRYDPSNISEVVESADPDKVSDWLNDGWVLLDVNAEIHPTKFSLGKE